MYRSRIQKLAIRLRGVVECNHPIEFVQSMKWNDKQPDGTYGPIYSGWMCGLCYSKVELKA